MGCHPHVIFPIRTVLCMFSHWPLTSSPFPPQPPSFRGPRNKVKHYLLSNFSVPRPSLSLCCPKSLIFYSFFTGKRSVHTSIAVLSLSTSHPETENAFVDPVALVCVFACVNPLQCHLKVATNSGKKTGSLQFRERGVWEGERKEEEEVPFVDDEAPSGSTRNYHLSKKKRQGR